MAARTGRAAIHALGDGQRPVRALNVAANLIPRITAHNDGVGRHLTRAYRRAFLGGPADRRMRRSFRYLIREAGS
jgi:hypothetical protein